MTTPGGGEPRTVDVPLGLPSSTATYVLPPGITFDVEAVYVEVNATGAGGAVTAELTISEQSGVVIAKKKQGATIPAGSTGSATWALRLDEGAAASSGGGIEYGVENSGTYLHVAQTDAGGELRFDNQGANGTVTIELTSGASVGGTLTLHTSSNNVPIVLDAAGQLNGNGNGGSFTFTDDFTISVSGAHDLIFASQENVRLVADDDVELFPSRDLYLSSGTFGAGGNIFAALPLGDPGVSGALYVDGAGVVKQSP